MGYRVAVVGATGNVGREKLNILAEPAFPVDELALSPPGAARAGKSRSGQ
jgi:aspartate-semialdehyde dehydrogenase